MARVFVPPPSTPTRNDCIALSYEAGPWLAAGRAPLNDEAQPTPIVTAVPISTYQGNAMHDAVPLGPQLAIGRRKVSVGASCAAKTISAIAPMPTDIPRMASRWRARA